MMPHQFYQVNSITRINQLHFKNMLDLGELLLVKTPMEVILRVTVVVKKMMVVMKHWILL
jgi:hypothetical protein